MSSAAQENAIHAIIYDLDGVLVSTDEYHYRAWKRLADEEDIPFDRSINERLRGVGRMESLTIILEQAQRTYTDQERAELAERKNQYYVESLQTLGEEAVLEGARETVLTLRKFGFRQATASSSKNAALILERTALGPLFDSEVNGNMISRSKPDPEIFLKAATSLKAAPEHCVVVEDAVSGIQAGNAAGMRCFAVGSAARQLATPRNTDQESSRQWGSAPSLAGEVLVRVLRPFAPV